MMVLVITAAPAGLRGELTRWLMEIDSGVFVGNPSQRIRAELWQKVKEGVRDGRALLVYRAQSEQRLRVETHRHHWEPVDLDGLTLMRRPLPREARAPNEAAPTRRTGWSTARAAYRSRQPAWKRGGQNRQSE
ncbi:type I-E CRISPR-associated endoribonuclease Cas2e [Micrococcus sp.]|uniref:type I-E CRISPR-associated endoribonuclease Cas2e n=1 Tax=Micrococcus sp. TaxID=1271 RepID=UPI002A91D0A1|nr:type I-E CRISPR-associated endoribonuclease Cas2e [Micrococcus sp.]MDY6054506.1 type I-E CRISPR-associated endoribonuclease Cas2e [Micrococcus sp.]